VLTSGRRFVALKLVAPPPHPGSLSRGLRMDALHETEPTDTKTTYKTSKQVQAWFLKRSRDRWKNKARQNNAELKRLRQRVADVEASRAHWRAQAESARHDIERLRPAMAEPQGRLDPLAGDASPKKSTPFPA
jgi:hypothetical protein